MNTDVHQCARLLIALSSPEALATAEQHWLAAHLEGCAACRQFAESSVAMIRSLRAIPITAGANLVAATRMRVRQRAQQLRRRQEWLWVVSVCCAVLTLFGGLTTAALWRGFAWIGEQARVSAPVWETSYVVVCFMPAILIAVLLLARGTHMTDYYGHCQE